jgi:multiple sugar transport system substrate-binding protein
MTMKRPRRLLTVTFCVAVVTISALTGCSSHSGQGSATPSAPLKLADDKPAWSPYFDDMGALAKKQLGFGVTPVGYSDENTYQAYIDATFRTDIKPDLFTWQTGGLLKQIAALGQVTSTSAIWKQAIADGNLPAGLEPYYTVNGQQYCVPQYVSYWGMFYNKHIFAKYGLHPPTTWAQFLNVAQTLKSHGVTPFYETTILFTFVWFEQLLAGTDPTLYNQLADGKASYTSAGVVNAMKIWQTFIDDGYMSNPGLTTPAATLLQQGTVAMAPFGTWFNPSMTQLNLKPGKDYGFFIIPNANPALPKTSVVLESGPLCAPTNGPDPAASTRFMAWWIGQRPQRLWSSSRGDLSANPKVTLTGNADLSAVAGNVRAGKYTLLLRYYEATPPPILNTALEVFANFMVHPDSLMADLNQIQAAASSYWSGNKAGS